jgi:hypothetical protein
VINFWKVGQHSKFTYELFKFSFDKCSEEVGGG